MIAWFKQVDNYWFGKGSPVALGVIRILIGFLALTNFLMIAIDFDAWFTERGFAPMNTVPIKMGDLRPDTYLFGYQIHLPFSVPRISLLNYFGLGEHVGWTLFIYGLTVLAALTTMLGLWTKPSTIILALGTVSIHLRNGFIIHGGDTVLRIMVLYLALAPCGLACSLDRVIGLWKGRISPVMPQVSLWVQKLIAYNIALIYFTTFWHKMHGYKWRDGTATWYPARLNEFDRFWVPDFFERPPFIYISTYGTLMVELALGTLVFYKPMRKWALLGGLGMHFFIEYSMNVPLFAFMICSCYVAFYSGEEVTDWFRRLGQRFQKLQVKILTPQGKSLSPGPASALAAMDPLALVTYGDDGNATNDWQGSDAAGKPISPVKASWKRSLAAWPIGWIPGVWRKILDRALQTAPIKEEQLNGQGKKLKKAAAR